jgi:hypothetical protein
MATGPPATTPENHSEDEPASSAYKPLDAEDEVNEARRIAARWDEIAREAHRVKFENLEKHSAEGTSNRLVMALTAKDAPFWRVRVRVSQVLILCSFYILKG